MNNFETSIQSIQPPIMRKSRLHLKSGFALISTISVMVLLMVIALAMLSLSTMETRSNQNGSALARAQANARMALMIAIGELQVEMGPDMRISSLAALQDTNPTTVSIEGVEQPNWMATYNSWGSWLNAPYVTPEGTTLNIADTYTSNRSAMFRRWLVSLPQGEEDNIDIAKTGGGLNASNSVILVGAGTLGETYSLANPKQITRAFLTSVEDGGRFAWWIGPENHKAKVNLSAKTRDLDPDEWAVAQGTTAQISTGVMNGLDTLDTADNATDQLLTKAFSLQTLSLDDIGLGDEISKSHFFNLTESSKGLLASVKTGGLKKDLSLLLDRNNVDLPLPYRFVPANNVEPSIRPLSSDILANGAALPKRPFTSWSAMRGYYRMYRQVSDLTLTGNANFHTGSGGPVPVPGSQLGSLSWDGQKPFTRILSPKNFDGWSTVSGGTRTNWTGENGYLRLPIIAKLTFLHSVQTKQNPTIPTERRCFNLFSPVVTLWNPYNTEMRFPSNTLGIPASINGSWPTMGYYYVDGVRRWGDQSGLLGNDQAYFNSNTGADIVIGPGEFKVFSHRSIYTNINDDQQLYPGFDPSAIGGTLTPDDGVRFFPRSFPTAQINAGRIATRLEFDNYFGWNCQWGQTPGSLSVGLIYGRQHIHILHNLYQIDWFKDAHNQSKITSDNILYNTSNDPILVGYTQLALKCLSQPEYESITWEQDWRARNWIQSPPFYFGSGLYMSENDTTAHTQRLDSPYNVALGPISSLELPKVVGHTGERAFLGSGSVPYEKVTAVPAIELPTAPISNLAGFSGMRMSPGWIWPEDLNPIVWMRFGPRAAQAPFNGDGKMSAVTGDSKRVAYQSGITGPGIGNSFMHPMIPRTGIYQFHNNSISQDRYIGQGNPIVVSDTKAYCDYWDHVFVLNDALWDDYYLSTLANQTRPGASNALSLSANIDKLVAGQPIANTRYEYYNTSLNPATLKLNLLAVDGYLKSAAHLMVDGSFNVNSTSVEAWYALFAGIREREMYYRKNDGTLAKVDIPNSARIALSRFETPNSNLEVTDPSLGVLRDDGNQSWTGVRFLTDAHLALLAEKCVEQVKLRGPFLNFSEFINRRLSNDALGLMGALQTAIDYDDGAPNPASINYRYKQSASLMMNESDLGTHDFKTPAAAAGSRLAGTPGYIIQSDLLKPIVSTLTVRDDTFRIRTYGESLDAAGNVEARVWCEALVQRIPEYCDPTNSAEIPARQQNSAGDLQDNTALTNLNRMFGRKFQIQSFRWLNENEI